MGNSLKWWLFVIGGAVVLLVINNLVVFKYVVPNRYLNTSYNPTTPTAGLPPSNSNNSLSSLPSAPKQPALPASTSTCVILPQSYCDTGKLISYPAGSAYPGNPVHVAFSLPAGTNIYLPFDVSQFGPPGKSANIGGKKYPITVADSKDGRYYISIVGKIDDVNFSKNKGGYLGKVNGAPVSAIGNYDFVVTFFDTNSANSADLNLAKQFFPSL